jgi:hypothetical protein
MTKQEKPLVVGVGTSGSSIALFMKDTGFLAEYSFASFNRRDVPEQYQFFDWRCADYNGASDYLRNLASNAEFTIVAGGVGGVSGSKLIPKIAGLISSTGVPTLALVLLPFRGQNWMEFAAASSISRIKTTRAGFVVVDRQQFVREELKEMPIEQTYQHINEKVACALVNLLTEKRDSVEVLCRGQSLMQLSEHSLGFTSSLASVLKNSVVGRVKEVSDVFLISGGSRPITLDDSLIGSSGIRNILAPDSKLHFINGRTKISGAGMVAMLSHVDGSLQLRITDPLEKLNSAWIDPEPEYGLNIPLDLDRLD